MTEIRRFSLKLPAHHLDNAGTEIAGLFRLPKGSLCLETPWWDENGRLRISFLVDSDAPIEVTAGESFDVRVEIERVQ